MDFSGYEEMGSTFAHTPASQSTVPSAHHPVNAARGSIPPRGPNRRLDGVSYGNARAAKIKQKDA
jgi:hypothetical protein